MKVSIITPTYNSENTLEKTMLSVFEQTYPDIEYIVIDGLSQDNTIDIIEKHKKHIHTYISEKDDGIYHAMNKGILLATGDVVGFLNSDDVFADTSVIQDIVDTFVFKKTDAVYADILYVNTKAKVLRKWVSGKYVPNAFLYGWSIPHPTFYVRRDIYLNLGLYRIDKIFYIASDYELSLRYIHVHDISLAYLNRVVVHFLVGGVSGIKFFRQKMAQDKLAWKVNGLDIRWYTYWMKIMRKVLFILMGSLLIFEKNKV